MKILKAQQIRDIDAFTIQNKPISSIDMMENAAKAIVEWIADRFSKSTQFHIICGPGNNGGDGLAVGRLLLQQGYSAKIYIPAIFKEFSEDNLQNQERLQELNIPIQSLTTSTKLDFNEKDIIIDALFGSGLNRELSGNLVDFVLKINKLPNLKIAIDIPSGLFSDQHNMNENIVQANHTIAFEIAKLALLLSENERFVGNWHLVKIGLLPAAIAMQDTEIELIDLELIKSIFEPRKKFAHKGSFGHSLLIAGSYGKMGAAVLAVQAALRSGSGLVTGYIPKCGYEILQISAPEAMTLTDKQINLISEFPDINNFTAIGIGPGIGKEKETQQAFEAFITHISPNKKLVLDADALNICSENKELLDFLPENTILTPHPKEFERLAGKWENDYKKLEVQRQFSQKYRVIVILKGAHTSISFPDGRLFFNSTGNPGMATGGSGDVLTGIVTSLLSQGYTPSNAAILGVWLHGMAGDLAAKKKSQESLLASDIIAYLGKAFRQITN